MFRVGFWSSYMKVHGDDDYDWKNENEADPNLGTRNRRKLIKLVAQTDCGWGETTLWKLFYDALRKLCRESRLEKHGKHVVND